MQDGNGNADALTGVAGSSPRMRGSLRIKHGNYKAEAKTFCKYKEKTSPMSDAHSPERNVQNDSAKSSSTTSVLQGQEGSKKNVAIANARDNSPTGYSSHADKPSLAYFVELILAWTGESDFLCFGKKKHMS